MKHFITDSASTAPVPLLPLTMNSCRTALLKLLSDTSGQDFLEYALMAGFVATVAATISPTFASGAITMFSKVNSVMGLTGS